ncbi:MAG: prephenate dehydrogenase [Anaeroplasma sp.]
MKVLIVGLGLMGGAYAYRLSKKGYIVYGSDIDSQAISYAKNNNYIIDGDVDCQKFISMVDLIILAIYPQAIINFLRKYKHLFNDNLLITDICGVKSSFISEATELSRPACYLSHHPMAGREKVGILYSKECVFEEANFIITTYNGLYFDKIEILKQLAIDLGFKRISTIDYTKHDSVVGFTSQLTHAIAVSLVNSDHADDTKNYIGDSYRDLTRIAMINDDLWSELFLENKENLFKHIESFESELDRLKIALKNNDKEVLKDIFKSSTKIRKEMEK